MTEAVLRGQHRYSRSIGATFPMPAISPPAPNVDMVPNPDFTFPRLPQTSTNMDSATSSVSSPGRPMSFNMSSYRPRTADGRHRKAVSTLPNFSFNAVDSSGIQTQHPEVETAQATPSRGGHKRTTSEFVGGMGVTGAMSASPTRTSALQVPEGRGHKHRRSVAVSHDLTKMMAEATDAQPRLSSSLPSTPLELSPHAPAQPYFGHHESASRPSTDAFGPVLDSSLVRPPSRPRVEFSDDVEYIPRPLSTISSETESSFSTVRGHSVNNSISSVLSLSNPSPPSSRVRATFLETTLEDEPRVSLKSSLEISRRVEREGEWLKHGSLTANVQRPATEPVSDSNQLSCAVDDRSAKPRVPQKKHSSTRSLGFDRRRSEPSIGMHVSEPSRLSALSLQISSSHVEADFEDVGSSSDHRSSTRKIKDWAVSKITRKQRPQQSEHIATSVVTSFEPEPPVAETDLDAVFSMESDVVDPPVGRPQHCFDAQMPSISHQSSFDDQDAEEYGTMLDLDAALGPFKTPTLGSQKRPKQLHSYRRFDDFVGPGLHYQPMHERTLSAPVLMAFDQARVGTPPQQPMADVFEEDEEDDDELATQSTRRASAQYGGDDSSGVGVAIVDHDENISDPPGTVGLDEGLGIQRDEWETERSGKYYGNTMARLSTPVIERRSSSIIEQTILEEASPVDSVAIVEDHEEPRSHSLTKSSNSSETPTLLAAQTDLLSLPDGQQPFTTPDTYHSSTFSSPDFTRLQGSFDTSRVGTSASSITDNRTTSSSATGDQTHDVRISVDDVPSLTSSRSTMISTMHANSSRRDVTGIRTPSVASGTLDSAAASERRRKRTSIQSLSQLVGSPFGPRPTGLDEARPQTATDATVLADTPKKKEHRLKKLMFWKSKHRQASTSTIL